MKINEMVVLYIDKDEIVWPPGEPPKYSTLEGISSEYSFWMRGAGAGAGEFRVADRRWACWCEACYKAFESCVGIDARLHIEGCKRSHLTRFKESAIKCTAASGIANAKARQQALWKQLRPLLRAGKFAAVQARELWSSEECIHLRPGHFWACELGDADGNGSPILHTYTKKNEYHTLSNGAKHRGDTGDCLLLLRCYYNRVADDPNGLTFVRWQPTQQGEFLVVNSCEVRAVQGRQQCDFRLMPICAQCRPNKRCERCTGGPVRRNQSRSQQHQARRAQNEASLLLNPQQRWALDLEIDADVRKNCVSV